jgi:N,N'-diacetyllegionaminate synthase
MVLIISECGINHNGLLPNAKAQIYNSKWAGADVAKFQFYNPEKVLGLNHPDLQYAKSCQFTKEQHEELKAYCDEVGIEYLVSIFDIADIAWADKLCKRHKIASRMNSNDEFITKLKRTGKEIILSSRFPIPVNDQVHSLFCITDYPTPIEKMRFNPQLFNGLSSHCPNIAPSIYAVAHGATILENHTTEDRRLPGCDQSSSITYAELKDLCKIVRDMGAMND